MKNLLKSSHLLLITVLTLSFYSCQKEDEIPLQEEQGLSEKLITKIDYGESGKINFTQLSDGEIIIDALVKSEIKIPINEELDPVEFYEKVTNKAAPTSLKKASIAALEKAQFSNESEEGEVLEPSAFSSPQEKYTAAEFQDLFCPTANWDYAYCWLNRTGTSYVSRRCFSMRTYASPYRGTIRHRLKKGSSTVRDHTVLQNWYSYISSYGGGFFVDPRRESRVFEASGDAYHHTIFGTD